MKRTGEVENCKKPEKGENQPPSLGFLGFLGFFGFSWFFRVSCRKNGKLVFLYKVLQTKGVHHEDGVGVAGVSDRSVPPGLVCW
jgi:hypothetical protein